MSPSDRGFSGSSDWRILDLCDGEFSGLSGQEDVSEGQAYYGKMMMATASPPAHRRRKRKAKGKSYQPVSVAEAPSFDSNLEGKAVSLSGQQGRDEAEWRARDLLRTQPA